MGRGRLKSGIKTRIYSNKVTGNCPCVYFCFESRGKYCRNLRDNVRVYIILHVYIYIDLWKPRYRFCWYMNKIWSKSEGVRERAAWQHWKPAAGVEFTIVMV